MSLNLQTVHREDTFKTVNTALSFDVDHEKPRTARVWFYKPTAEVFFLFVFFYGKSVVCGAGLLFLCHRDLPNVEQELSKFKLGKELVKRSRK